MPLPRKVGDRRAANWNLFSKNSRKIISSLADLALTNMGLGDKAAALSSGRTGHGRAADRERRDGWSHSDRDPRPGGGADGGARPRHRRFTETSLDTVRRRAGLKPCRSLLRCSGSIRCSIRSGTIRVSKNSARKSSRLPRRSSV